MPIYVVKKRAVRPKARKGPHTRKNNPWTAAIKKARQQIGPGHPIADYAHAAQAIYYK